MHYIYGKCILKIYFFPQKQIKKRLRVEECINEVCNSDCINVHRLKVPNSVQSKIIIQLIFVLILTNIGIFLLTHYYSDFVLFSSEMHKRSVQLQPDEERGWKVRSRYQILVGPIRRDSSSESKTTLKLSFNNTIRSYFECGSRKVIR